MDFSKSRKELAVKFSSDITVKVNEYMMEVDNELSKEGFNDQQIGLIVNNSAMGMIINIIGFRWGIRLYRRRRRVTPYFSARLSRPVMKRLTQICGKSRGRASDRNAAIGSSRPWRRYR